MKRKLFFMLFALVALVSFQTFAADPVKGVWIKVDTTGLNPDLPYSGNKIPMKNWLIYDAKTKISPSGSILDDGNKNLFNVSQVSATDRYINIQSTNAGSTKLTLNYGGNDITVFEVVQFKDANGVPATGTSWGSNFRETQPLSPTMQGYLMPAQGGNGVELTDITASMLMVAADKDGNLAIKQFKDVFNVSTATTPVITGTLFGTPFVNYNNKNSAGAIGDGNAAALSTVFGTTITYDPTKLGAYDMGIYYVSENYVFGQPLTADISYLTQYNGTKTAAADVLADAAGWSHGLPMDYTGAAAVAAGVTIPMNDPQAPAGSNGTYAIVLQSNNADGTPAVNAPVVTGLSYVGDWRPVYIKLTEECNCPQQFIAPDWMAENQLLNFPLKNQIWKLDGPANLSFDKNPSTGEAIVKTGITNVKFTYETTITGGACSKANAAIATTGVTFASDVDVPLYRIQNANGDYLTVDASTNAFDAASTLTDVTGVNLKWVSTKYTATATADKNIALQLFAISGSQTNPTSDKWYTTCNAFTYLPLASYVANYKTGKVDDASKLRYNVNLGMAGDPGVCSEYAPVNDITSSFRVGYMGKLGDLTQQNLVVANASGDGKTNVTPVTSKWQKLPLPTFAGCENGSVYVQATNKTGKYYTINKLVDYKFAPESDAMTGNILAHWIMDTDENGMITFTPEWQKSIYGGALCATRNQLQGQYLLTEKIDDYTYVAFDQTGYGVNGNYTPTLLTLHFTCIPEHTTPFLDLEDPAVGYNLDAAKLAILETPFLDRNITDKIVGENNGNPTPIIKNGATVGYRVYIDTVSVNGPTVTYLNVYRENRRDLADNDITTEPNHVVPYYSFSVTLADKSESFMNIYSGIGGIDSVYWSPVTPAVYTALTQGDNTNNYGRYKFCLPYQLDENGNRVKQVTYNGKPFSPVYIQSMEVSKNDIDGSPFLVVAGSATKYVTARKLTDALTNHVNDWTDCGIYSMIKNSYVDIDPLKVTSWIFGDSNPNGNVWVPIHFANVNVSQAKTQDEFVGKKVTGRLTLLNQSPNNQGENVGGYTFVDLDNQEPVNHGILAGTNATKDVTLTYTGVDTIGVTAMRPIWYYQISLPDKDGKTVYLTDATDSTDHKAYWNTLTNQGQSVSYPYGIFTALGNAKADIHDINKDAAKKFDLQNFGFKYQTSDQDKQQLFWIVSNADYRTPRVDRYRYLAQVNTRLIFVGGNTTENILVFQWGKGVGDGYTKLELVGQGNIFGVQGGVQFLNTSGAVEIYSIDGRLIKSTMLNGTSKLVPAPRGIAIVKAGSKVVKVVVQ